MVGAIAAPDVLDGRPGNGRGVLLVTTNFPPNRQAGTHRLLRFARHLDTLGWRVSVLTMAPESYRVGVPVDERLCTEIPPSVHVVRTRVPGRGPQPATAGRETSPSDASPAARPPEHFVKRTLRRVWRDVTSTPDAEFPWALTAVGAGTDLVRQGRVDVILSSAPPFTCHLVAAEIARRSKRPWVADFRDPWSRAPWALEFRNQGWTGVVHRRLERLTINRATRVVLNTSPMQEDFAAHYPTATAAKFLTIPNGFDAEALERTAQPVVRTAPKHTVVLCHTGNLYQARDPRPLLRAMANLATSGQIPPTAFSLQLVGGAGGEFDAPGEVARLGLAGMVEFVPPVSHGQSLGYLRAADVLLVVQPDTRVQVPVKLYEYLWARKPILALASDGAVADLIREGRIGHVVPADDEAAIGVALASLYAHRDTLSQDFVAPEQFLLDLEGKSLARRLHHVLAEVTA